MSIEETGHTEKFRASKLRPGETVIASLKGYIGEMMGRGDDTQHNGALILTNMRVAFYRKGILGEVLETIPIDKLSSIETRSMLGYRVMALHTSHDEMKFKSFASAESFQHMHDHIERLRRQDGPKSQPATTALGPLEKLKQLGELRTAGVISEAEFEQKKKQLLAQI